MKLDFIDLCQLTISKANMRYAKKAPDVSDILPTVRARGVLVPLIVRPKDVPGSYEIVAGARRFHAASLVAAEKGEADPLPCAILDENDDAAAIEASLIENIARLDPDEVTRWETFTRLVRQGRSVEDIATTFGLPEPSVRRVLALGNLLPRIRDLYRRQKLDAVTVRHLTMASKRQQQAWLALHDDPDTYCPTGHQLKAWLFGGQSIKAAVALFDLEQFKGVLVADLFGEDRYFADADAFWEQQNAVIAQRQTAYLDTGWSDAVIVPPAEHFHSWDYEKAGKRKGGRVYIEVRSSGEVIFHEGYVTRAEARRIERGEAPDTCQKPVRPEITGPMQTYIDLHRHAAVRAAMTAHPAVALRLMVAHAIAGSPLWTVRIEPQASRHDVVRESIETCRGETAFDEQRRAVLALLGVSPEDLTVTGSGGDVAGLFLRLLDLPDAQVLDVIAIVMGETLASGSVAVEAVGGVIGIDMARYWQADEAFFQLVRDKEVLTAIIGDVAGQTVAAANGGQKAKTLKDIVRDHLDGANGRDKVEGWVPRWMAFPPSCYTTRGGVGTVAAHERVEVARLALTVDPDPTAPAGAATEPEPTPLAA
ncbi:MAG: chromosome partitioning protein ParB [Sphingobium sp. 66-54]|nr:MAG: chromosome partitioning protein ParB [Sphingobium sp. 66-54]